MLCVVLGLFGCPKVTVTGELYNSGDGIVASGAIHDGDRITDVNHGSLTCVGVKPEQVIIRPVAEKCCADGEVVGVVVTAVVIGASNWGNLFSPPPTVTVRIDNMTNDLVMQVGSCINFVLVKEVSEGEGEPAPVVAITSPTSGQQYEEDTDILFKATVVGGQAPFDYRWDFHDGQEADDTRSTFFSSFTGLGSVTVELTVTDANEKVGRDAIAFLIIAGEDEGEGEGEGEGEPKNVMVPNLSGLNWAQADVILSNVGLSVGQVTTEVNNAVPANIIVRWSPIGTVLMGTAINLVVSTGPPPQMSVEITVPASGQVFKIGDVVTVKILPQGDPARGPYRLLVRDAELASRTIWGVTLGTEYSFDFTLTMMGDGFFTAYLKGGGASVGAYCPYSVIE